MRQSIDHFAERHVRRTCLNGPSHVGRRARNGQRGTAADLSKYNNVPELHKIRTRGSDNCDLRLQQGQTTVSEGRDLLSIQISAGTSPSHG